MIHLTKLNGVECVLNSDLILHLESTPDTTITLTTGEIINVRERPEEVIGRVVEFRRSIMRGSWMEPAVPELREER